MLARLLRPSPLLAVRALLLLAGGLVLVAMLGPFSGAESSLGLSDKAAHVVAFYLATIGAFGALPHVRRTDAALGVLLFAVGTELVQGLTGRTMSLQDLSADAIGIFAAVFPATVERWRYAQRRREDRARASA